MQPFYGLITLGSLSLKCRDYATMSAFAVLQKGGSFHIRLILKDLKLESRKEKEERRRRRESHKTCQKAEEFEAFLERTVQGNLRKEDNFIFLSFKRDFFGLLFLAKINKKMGAFLLHILPS